MELAIACVQLQIGFNSHFALKLWIFHLNPKFFPADFQISEEHAYGTGNYIVSQTHSVLLVTEIITVQINLDLLSFFLSSTDFSCFVNVSKFVSFKDTAHYILRYNQAGEAAWK